MRRFEKWGLHYIVGLPKNAVLLERVALADMYQTAGCKQRMIGEFDYAARSWDRPRRVIARLEHDARGANPRFIVTNLKGGPKALYERVYCARGEAENRIKEAAPAATNS